MSDWPYTQYWANTILSSTGPNSVVGDLVVATGNAFNTSGAWPAANRAHYLPVWIHRQVTVYQMSFIVATASGNYDIGIYDDFGHRIVSKGSTPVPAAGLAKADIADTTINPGAYYLALNIDNTTASVRRSNVGTVVFRASGVAEQTVGAITLPATAAFSGVSTAYAPLVCAHLRAVV